MRHVYISYHREDGEFVARLIRQLEDAGFRVWSDHERLRTNEIRWRASIDEAIRDAFVMVAITTPRARNSEQINYEWMFALGSDIPVIPVMLKPCELHPRLQNLDRVSFIDAHAQPWGKLIGLIREAEDDGGADRDSDQEPGQETRFRPTRSRFGADMGQSGERLSPIERLRRANRTDDELPLFRTTRDGQPPIDRLLKALEDDDRERRARAAYQLGEIGDRATIPALLRTLRDEDWRVREAAALALAKLKAAAAVPAMLEMMRQTRPGPFGGGGTTRNISQAIADIGTSALPVLIDALSDDEPRIRFMIVEVLGQIADADAIPALTSALRDPEARVRWRAADALGRLGNESTVPELLVMLKDADNDARISAAWALGQIGHASAVDGLIEMLHDREWRTRWAAVQALWEIGEAAILALIATLHDRDEYVRRAAIRALVEIGESAIAPLIETLTSRDWDVRWSAAAALQDIGERAVPALVVALGTLDWQAAWAAAETLKRIGTKDAQQAVAVWQQDHDQEPDTDQAAGHSTEHVARTPRDTDTNTEDG